MSEEQALYATLAQADQEEEDRIVAIAAAALDPFLTDQVSRMALSRAIADIWPLLHLAVEKPPLTVPQRAEAVRQHWRETAKRTLRVDLIHPAPEPQTPRGVDL